MKKSKWVIYALLLIMAVTIFNQNLMITANNVQIEDNGKGILKQQEHSDRNTTLLLRLSLIQRKIIKQVIVLTNRTKTIQEEAIEKKILPSLNELTKVISILIKKQNEVATYVNKNLDPKPSFLKLRLATVEIKVGKIGGAGTIIKMDDDYLYVLTAQHIVDCKGKITVQATNIEAKKYIKIKNIDRKNVYKNEKLDMALIKVPRPEGKFGSLALSKKKPTIGEKIYTIGHPLNLTYTVNSGIVSNYTKRIFGGSKQEYMVVSAPAFSGNSGGTCINSFNEIVGIVVGIAYTVEEGIFDDNSIYLTHLVFVVTIDKINKFMEDLEIEISNSN